MFIRVLTGFLFVLQASTAVISNVTGHQHHRLLRKGHDPVKILAGEASTLMDSINEMRKELLERRTKNPPIDRESTADAKSIENALEEVDVAQAEAEHAIEHVHHAEKDEEQISHPPKGKSEEEIEEHMEKEMHAAEGDLDDAKEHVRKAETAMREAISSSQTTPEDTTRNGESNGGGIAVEGSHGNDGTSRGGDGGRGSSHSPGGKSDVSAGRGSESNSGYGGGSNGGGGSHNTGGNSSDSGGGGSHGDDGKRGGGSSGKGSHTNDHQSAGSAKSGGGSGGGGSHTQGSGTKSKAIPCFSLFAVVCVLISVSS